MIMNKPLTNGKIVDWKNLKISQKTWGDLHLIREIRGTYNNQLDQSWLPLNITMIKISKMNIAELFLKVIISLCLLIW